MALGIRERRIGSTKVVGALIGPSLVYTFLSLFLGIEVSGHSAEAPEYQEWVGAGSTVSCRAGAVAAALPSGGTITYNCGSMSASPYTVGSTPLGMGRHWSPV